MLDSTTDLLNFWMTPWSRALRGACVWLERLGAPISGTRPDAEAPKWLRPLCVQRWVGQAVADRLAWVAAHPEAAAYRCGRESEPCWTEVGWATYARRCLRAMSEETLRWLFVMEVERLVRSLEEAPGLVGGADWTRGVLGACEHVAQVYGEWRRRHKARRARAIVREELAAFVEWTDGSEPGVGD